VILVQHVDVWPYTMRDSEGVIKKAGGVGDMWMAIVKQKPGEVSH